MPFDAPGTATSARTRGINILAVIIALGSGLPSPSAGAQARPLPTTLWGVTLDNTAHIGAGALAQETASLQALPTMPIARLVMDVGTKPAAYAAAVSALHPVSYLMAELGDSSEMKHQSVAAYRRFEGSLVSAESGTVDLWEIGNEVNGEWVGSTSKEVAKITDAYDSVKEVGGMTALTLYYNPNCWTEPSHAMFTWARNNIPTSMKAGLDYVLISYYPGGCDNYWPTQAGWQSVFDQLHTMFPNAKLGFGESGISSDAGSSATKAALLSKYYTLDITGDNYVGGYFWWYYAEDAVPYEGNDVWNALSSAISSDRPQSSHGLRETSVATEGLTPCPGSIGITKLQFVPPSVMAGRSSTVHLSARNCLDESQDAELTMEGRFTGGRTSGCPIIDPLTRNTTFAPHEIVRSKLAYEVPASCHASPLRVTATFSSSSGTRLAQRSAFLSIMEPTSS